jgi:hypothetical protein
MAILNGTKIKLFIGTGVIANGKSANLKFSMSPRDTTTKDSNGNRELAEGLMSASFDFKGLLDPTASPQGFSQLNTALNNRTPLTVVFAQTDSGVGKKYTATAYCTALDQAAEVEGNVEFGASFECDGELVEAGY